MASIFDQTKTENGTTEEFLKVLIQKIYEDADRKAMDVCLGEGYTLHEYKDGTIRGMPIEPYVNMKYNVNKFISEISLWKTRYDWAEHQMTQMKQEIKAKNELIEYYMTLLVNSKGNFVG
jgi:hypothetical protein